MNTSDLIAPAFLIAMIPGFLMSIKTCRTAVDDYRSLSTTDPAILIAAWGAVQMEFLLLFIQVVLLGITISAWLDTGASPARTLVFILALLAVGASAFCRNLVRRKFDRITHVTRNTLLQRGEQEEL